MRSGASGIRYVTAVKLVESEAEGGETTEVIGEDGTARLVQVLQVGEDDEVEIEFGNLRGTVEVENEPPEFDYFDPEHGSTLDDQDVDFVFAVTDANSGLPEPEDLPDIDGDGDYTPVAALVHGSQCYNDPQTGVSLEAVDALTLHDGAIYCHGQPEVRLIVSDRDFDEIDNGFDVETTIVLPEWETSYVTFIVCDIAGNCTAYDPDEDSDIALSQLSILPTPPVDPCLVSIAGDTTINGSWTDRCVSGRLPELYGGTGDRYARYYTFNLGAVADVTITLTSTEDAYLYLLGGADESGEDLFENDDVIPYSDTNSRIEETLQPGDYTIEATTYFSEKTGDFTLVVEGISQPETEIDCDRGDAVTDPDANADLVSDCEVLLTLRDPLAGDAKLNWSADVRIESWDGVGVWGEPMRVFWLTLYEQGLTGVIPPELGDLDGLEELILTGNELSGEIPPELARLDNLRSLWLGDNRLTGAIPPELSRLDLKGLFLSHNQLTGSIPAQLSHITNLVYLELDDNQLTGEIPQELANLTRLDYLYLANNDLSGCIPEALHYVQENDLGDLGLPFCDSTDVLPPSDPCVVDMGDFESRLEVIDNYWDELCESVNRPSDGEYYARFFTFDLNEEADVTITLESDHDAYLYLSKGGGQPGNVIFRGFVIFEDDDTEGTNPRIRITLQPGSYTVEATTYEIGVTGKFRVGVETEALEGRPPISCVHHAGSLQSGWTINYGFDIDGECRSVSRPEDGEYYARYLALTVEFPSRVTLTLTSDEDAYLYLLEGYGVTGSVLDEDDDAEGTNSRIEATLLPGEYTIEATTYDEGVAGYFELDVELVSTSHDLCANGAAVPDPDDNPSLVRDCSALLDSKYILSAEPPLNWSADVTMDNWEGVTLGESPPLVTELRLVNRGLNGRIPGELDSLSGLRDLLLTANALTGRIPNLLNLNNLRFLELGSNRLSGQIREGLSRQSELEVLYLHDNKLSGEIPAELGDLENLSALVLQGNRLSGEIPAELGKLKNLDKMHLSDNLLVGEIPSELADIPNLYGLFLSGNDLSGCIPEGLRDVEENDFEELGLPFCVPPDEVDCIEPLPSVPAITIEDSWESECISVNRSSGRTYYARYYTVDLSEATPIEIEVTADSDPYVYLLEGEGAYGRVLFEEGGERGGVRLATTLEAGRYTIEVTTHDPDVTGDFQLAVRMMLDAGARCRNGVAVPSPYNSIELVNDCVTLLHTRFWVDVDRSLDWKTDTPIHEWEGAYC